jgi:hypothetical protein
MIGSVLSTAAQRPDSVRLYALDGGTLTIGDPTVFGLTREDVPDLMPVPAFLVVHPKRALLWDAGVRHSREHGSVRVAEEQQDAGTVRLAAAEESTRVLRLARSRFTHARDKLTHGLDRQGTASRSRRKLAP